MIKSVCLLAAVSMLLAGCGNVSNEDRCNDTGMAYIMSNNFVKQQLRAPSTAEFPRPHERGVHIENTELCTHEVIAYVDAQNGFGGFTRIPYYAKLSRSLTENSWRIIELELME